MPQHSQKSHKQIQGGGHTGRDGRAHAIGDCAHRLKEIKNKTEKEPPVAGAGELIGGVGCGKENKVDCSRVQTAEQYMGVTESDGNLEL
ncbi:hypothetical protein SESBI_22664 [Sesbania bispinosa]|nr:hypothetical protein SESBI_22664 [Sesbania bispinosa]